MDIFNQIGKMAIGSRLRMLTDLITEDASQIYELYGTELKAKWFPVFFVLSQGEPKDITSIAKEIRHSHPSVSSIVKEMSSKGYIKVFKDKTDGRRNVIGLSLKGKRVAEKIADQYLDVTSAINKISDQTKNDLWAAIEEWEFLLSEKSLLKRVIEEKKTRESRNIKIVPYKSKYQNIFSSLNERWIKTFFEMEEADYKALNDPQGYIINQGGYIFVALYNENPIGVCALLKMNDKIYDYEFAKMAVSPEMQGKSIGFLLGQTALKKAKELGAKKIYLESNTILKPAINLYQKLGFQKVAGHTTPYKRCNIQMELNIDK